MREGSFDSHGQMQELLDKYSLMVYRLAYAQTGARHDADDIYQEVFLRLVKSNPVFESEEHTKAWLIRVTMNCCSSFRLSAWRRKIVPYEEQTGYAAQTFVEEEFGDLHHALGKIPVKGRTIIHLFYYEGMSAEEIGRALRMPASTVRVQLSRTRKRLKILLECGEVQASV